MTVSTVTLLDQWQEYLRAVRGLSENTVYRYRKWVEVAVGSVPIGEVGFEELERHLRGMHARSYSTSARRMTIHGLRRFFEYLVARGVVGENPAAKLETPIDYSEEADIFTPGEIRRLIWGSKEGEIPGNAEKARDRVMLALMYAAGLRVSELEKITDRDLHWHEDECVYELRIRKGKGAKKPARIVLDLDTSRIITTWLPMRRMIWEAHEGILFPTRRLRGAGREAVRAAFTRRLKESGIAPRGRKLTPHSLRHSIATHLLESGWPIRLVQQHMRHASIATTEAYLHTKPENAMNNWRKHHPLKARKATKVTAAQLRRELLGTGDVL